jgi:hypothetical protein
VLNELITRDPIIGAGPKVQITPNDLRGAVDTASSALTAFLSAAPKEVQEPGPYWALFLSPSKEPPSFLRTIRAEGQPPPLKPSMLALGFTAMQPDIEIFRKGDVAQMVADAQDLVYRAHAGK